MRGGEKEDGASAHVGLRRSASFANLHQPRMKLRIYLHLLTAGLTALTGAGCANPGSAYAAQHPDLPPAHRQILLRGKIPNGDAVAGMTRAQVKLAMGGDPTTFDKLGTDDVWIYVRKKAVGRESFDDERAGGSGLGNSLSFTESVDFSPRVDVDLKTTIFFQGDRATHAQSPD